MAGVGVVVGRKWRKMYLNNNKKIKIKDTWTIPKGGKCKLCLINNETIKK